MFAFAGAAARSAAVAVLLVSLSGCGGDGAEFDNSARGGSDVGATTATEANPLAGLRFEIHTDPG